MNNYAIPLLPPRYKIKQLDDFKHQHDHMMGSGETWCIPFSLNHKSITFNIITTTAVPDLSLRVSITKKSPIGATIDFTDNRPTKFICAFNLPVSVSDFDNTKDFLLETDQWYFYCLHNGRNFYNSFKMIII